MGGKYERLGTPGSLRAPGSGAPQLSSDMRYGCGVGLVEGLDDGDVVDVAVGVEVPDVGAEVGADVLVDVGVVVVVVGTVGARPGDGLGVDDVGAVDVVGAVVVVLLGVGDGPGDALGCFGAPGTVRPCGVSDGASYSLISEWWSFWSIFRWLVTRLPASVESYGSGALHTLVGAGAAAVGLVADVSTVVRACCWISASVFFPSSCAFFAAAARSFEREGSFGPGAKVALT